MKTQIVIAGFKGIKYIQTLFLPFPKQVQEAGKMWPKSSLIHCGERGTLIWSRIMAKH